MKWALVYKTAIIGRYENERAAWLAHTIKVIENQLDLDHLGVIELRDGE